jgi:hypothetical protein
MSPTVFETKRAHHLHLALTAEEFGVHFTQEMQGDPSWHPSRFIPEAALGALLLVGSIPQGIGSPASDIDFVAIVGGEEDLPARFPGDPDIVFAARTGSDRANVVSVRRGLEIDITYITLPGLRTIHEGAVGQGVMPPLSDVKLLAQIRRGWTLQATDTFQSVLKTFRDDPLLDVRSCVRAFVGALKTLEDAAAARADSPALALHLGRLSVERGLGAVQAAEGLVGLGDKWLRLSDQRGGNQLSCLAEFTAFAEPLLFPSLDRQSSAVEAYLETVTSFLATIKAHIESKPAFALAYRFCRQIDHPQIVVGHAARQGDASDA